MSNERKGKQGFASMDPERQRAIAKKGGIAAHVRGTAHEFSPDEAREAGRKGGAKIGANREHMAEIGRLGGYSRGRRVRDTERPPPTERDPSEEGPHGSA